MKLFFTFFALASMGFGSTLLSSNLSSTSSSDITFYADSGGTLSVAPSSTAVDPALTSALSSTANAAGGNVELFSGSDALTDMTASGAFANAVPIVLNTGHSGGGNIQVRSLNGYDWFQDDLMAYNLTYGATNLANQYFADLVNAAISATTNPFLALALNSPANLNSLFTSFVNAGGFAQISDPNVSYLCVDPNGFPVVGLAGFLDTTDRLVALTGVDAATIAGAFPNGFQSSEVAIVNGEALYSFSAVPSGVVLPDGFDSYSATYEVVGSNPVPEPSASLLLILGGVAFSARRRR